MVVGKKALVIDDDAAFIRLVEQLLTQKGCEVLTAGNGQEGLRLLFIYKPDIGVKHFKGRDKLTTQDFFIISHNTTYLLLRYLSLPRKFIFLFYTFLIGQRNNLGFLRSFILLFQSPFPKVFGYTFASIFGKLKGTYTFFNANKSASL